MAAAAAGEDQAKSLHDELTFPLILADGIRKSAADAETSRPECFDIAAQVDTLSQMLRSIVRLSASPPHSFYDRPVRRITADVSKNLGRALTLVKRCRHSGFLLRHLFAITTSVDFRKVSGLLESSIGDLRWLLSILDPLGGLNLALPPIASNHEPVLAWVWSSIATLQMGRQLSSRIDSTLYLASLAEGSERNRQMIVDEGAVPPLLKMLRDCDGSAEGQIAASNALFALVDDVSRVRKVASNSGISLIVHVLGDSPMKVQIAVAALVTRMAEVDPSAREEFGNENVVKPLVSCLMMDLVLDDYIKTSMHSIYQINRELARNTLIGHSGTSSYHKVQSSSSFSSHDGSSSGGGANRRERENESPETKSELKLKCSSALWRLCRDSLLNSRKIVEGKGLPCLSKIIETEKGELLFNCLMTVMEMTAVAESNFDFRKGAWKPSSAPVKAILNQILRVIVEDGDPNFHITAIRTIGSLARNFSAKDTRFVVPLVDHLGNKNEDVATEAAIALVKFICPENHHRVEHSKTVVENRGVTTLMKLLKACERAKVHGLVLLCHLSLNVGNSRALEEARALHTLEGAARWVVAQNPNMKELIARAMHHLTLYQAGVHPHHGHGLDIV